eukprot:TRINITY_DN36818_c0_g1_i1.p1 TRINITY_DN36818_c0_g1~~TRINITY_DN36818_c0_g1_i1.p1  ORF type:complete len:381 (+),score=49.12 TRINITY_DN36818_c0_g1_i1:55-1143(+)
MEKIKKCIFNIPICGGFCAPTQSPEKTWLRHFSNEFTLPLAAVFMKCHSCLETCACCRRCGATGTRCGKKNRRPLMITSFWVSFTGWLLNFYAAGALFMSPGLLKATAWAHGELIIQNNISGSSWVGLHGRVDEVDCAISPDTDECHKFMSRSPLMQHMGSGVYQRAVRYDNTRACLRNVLLVSPDFEAAHPVFTEDLANASGAMCESCKKSATSTVSFVIMGMITQIPQMTTDLQRSTRFGDVNCQATMGCATSFWGTYSGISSLMSFSYSCWRKFPKVLPGVLKSAKFHWSMGPGYYCMLIATILKIWDAFAHLSVATPSVRHTKQKAYSDDLYDYMIQAELDSDEDSLEDSEDSASDSA